jgi:hypothetical protein
MRIEDRLDRMLDQALEMTFPVSDPIAVYTPEIDSVMNKHEEKTSDIHGSRHWPASDSRSHCANRNPHE